MTRKHGMPEVREGGVNVTPLIDIVMVLIVFFMLVAKIGVNRGIDKMATLPETLLGRKIEDMGNTLTLNVHQGESGGATIDALVPGPNGDEKRDLKLSNPPQAKDDVCIVLTALAKKNPQFNVILRCEGDVAYSDIEPLLVAFNMSHVKTYSFNTKNKIEVH